jgi:hypothetical protein
MGHFSDREKNSTIICRRFLPRRSKNFGRLHTRVECGRCPAVKKKKNHTRVIMVQVYIQCHPSYEQYVYV